MICVAGCKLLPQNRNFDAFPHKSQAECAARSRRHAGIMSTAVLLLAATCAHAQFGAQPVGAASGSQSISVTVTVAGTVSSVEVLTMGSANGDFAVGTGPSNCAFATLAIGGKCTQSVAFTPAAPGLHMGAVVLVGTPSGGAGLTVLGTAYLSGTGTGGLGVFVTGNVIPMAGQLGLFAAVDDGQTATQAELYLPGGEVVDGAGNMYIADTGHNRIRMVCGAAAAPTIQGTTCAGAGIISTIAGNGDPNYSGDGRPASRATVNAPSYVALDGAGNLYIADSGNNVIRMIDAATGVITTVAGNGAIGDSNLDLVGDSGPATSANLNQPQGVTLDANGNLYIADTGNHRIRLVNAAAGTISTIAGTGATNANGTGGYNGDNIQAWTAELNFPYAVAFDPAGNMYIPDSGNNRIRKVKAASGAITAGSSIVTVAGTGNPGATGCAATPIAATQAALWSPSGVAVDAAGNVYIADTQNAAIRKVSAATGLISTLLQSGCGTFYFGGQFANQELYGPTGLYLDGSGNLYIVDRLDMVVREVQGSFVALNYTTPVRQTETSQPKSQTVENDGNAALDLTTITADINAEVDDAVSGSCSNGETLAVDEQCELGAVFAPAGTPVLTLPTAETPAIDVAADTQAGVTTPNSPLVIKLVGTASPLASTATTVTSSLDPSGYGQSVTFTVTVNAAPGTGPLAATVSVSDTFCGSTAKLASGLSLNAAGAATFSISTLAVGQHSIIASYDATPGNDPNHMTSASTPALIQTVLEGTAVSLTSSLNPSTLGQSVSFTATVASSGGGVNPAGTVTFFDGSTPLATSLLSASGVAGYTSSTLANGTHQITAVYNGSASTQVQGSTSPVVNQDVQAASAIGVVSSLNPSTYGAPVTFTATVASAAASPATGTVNFLDNGVSIGTATLGGNPGAATFTISTLAVGTHPIAATYAGDSNNTGSSSAAPLNQTVQQAPTMTAVSAKPAAGIAGTSETISAAVQLVTGAAPLTGTVSFTSGSTTLGSASLNASGVAAITLTLAAGSYQIVAAYGGDSNALGSVSSLLSYSVALATTQTALTVTPSPAVVASPITFTATVTGNGATPAGSVNFLANGVVVGTSPLNGGTATFTDSALAAGSYAMTAEYLGNAGDAISTSANVNETVSAIPTTVTLASAATTGANPQVVLMASVVNNTTGPVPTGTVTFYMGGTSSGSGSSGNGGVSLGTVTLDASGAATLTANLVSGTNYSIYAAYGGDSDHGPSTSQTVNVSGTSTGFTVAVSPSTVNVPASQNVTVTVKLTSANNFTDTIGLGCASLPPMVNCHFAAVSLALPAGGTASTQLTIDTNAPLSGGAAAMSHPSRGGKFSFAGLFLPFCIAFACIFSRLRRRNAKVLTLALILSFTVAAFVVTGCSSFSQTTAAPGNYVIQITGTGTTTDAIEYQSVTLNVTK